MNVPTRVALVVLLLVLATICMRFQYDPERVTRVRLTLDVSQIRPETTDSQAFIYRGIASMTGTGDSARFPRWSRLELFESGRSLSMAHSLHADIRSKGGGRYSHWNEDLIFSSSDGSDPRTNGRVYEVSCPQLPGWSERTATVGLWLSLAAAFFTALPLVGPLFCRLMPALFAAGAIGGLVLFLAVPLVFPCAPTQAWAWIRGRHLLYLTVSQIPGWLWLWAMGGVGCAWAIRWLRPRAEQAAWIKAERGLSRRMARWGLILAVLLFLLPLFRQWSGIAEPMHRYDLYSFAFMGYIPLSDARSYLNGAHQLIAQGTLNEWNVRRPLNAAFLAARLAVTGLRLELATLMQVVLLAVSVFWLADGLRRRYGVWTGIGCVALCLAYAQCFMGTCLSEALGMTLGCVALRLLLNGTWSVSTLAQFAAGLGLALAMQARVGAITVLVGPVLYAVWSTWRGDWTRRMLLGLLAGTMMGLLFPLLLVRVYGGADNLPHSNAGYTFCGMAENLTWVQVREKYKSELEKRPSEKERAQFLWERGCESLRRQPDLALEYLRRSGKEFMGDLFLFLRTILLATLPIGEVISSRFVLLLAIGTGLWFGFALAMRECRREIVFWTMLLGCMLAFVPFIFLDGGWRVLAATWPLMAGVLSLWMFSPFQRDPRRSLDGKGGEGITFLGLFMLAALCGPALGHRLFAGEHVTERSTPIMLRTSTVTGVKVVTWPDDLKPDPLLPVVPSSVFHAWPAESWLPAVGNAASVSTPLPALLGVGMDSTTGNAVWFYLPVMSVATEARTQLSRPLMRSPRQEMNPYVRLIDADSLPSPLRVFLNSNNSEMQRLLEFCDWYSRRVDFGTRTHEIFHHDEGDLARSQVRERLFQASAPLELYCYQETFLLADILNDLGLSIRLLHLDYELSPAAQYSRHTQHWVAEIKLSEGDRWWFVDPSLGVFGLRSTDGCRVVDWLRGAASTTYCLPLVTLKPRWLQYTWEIANRRLRDAVTHGPSLTCAAIVEYLRAFDYGAFLACRLKSVREYAPRGWSQIEEVSR